MRKTLIILCGGLILCACTYPVYSVYSHSKKVTSTPLFDSTVTEPDPVHLDPINDVKVLKVKFTAAESDPTPPNPTPPNPTPPNPTPPNPTPPNPTPPNPVTDVKEPKAKLITSDSVSVKSYVVLDLTGTVSAMEPDFDVVFEPEGSTSFVTKLYNKDKLLVYGLLIPDKVGKYRIALVAFSTVGDKADTVRVYAFADINVVESGPPPGPTPGPTPGPEPPLPVPPPNPKLEDIYGMYTYTKDLLSQLPVADKWQTRVPKIYDCFDKMIVQAANFTDATKFVQATSDCYKLSLGQDYNYFSYYFFTPLKTQLAKINSSGKLPSTVDAHVQVWKEVSQALHGVKMPAVSSDRRR